MRDRTGATEAAKRASEMGRPPKSHFSEAGPRSPDSPPKDASIDSFQRRDQKGGGHRQDARGGGRGGGSDSEDSLGDSRNGRQQQQRRRQEEEEQERKRREAQQREQQQKEREQQNRSAPPAAAKGAQLPQRWEWPNWCLDFKNPVIEVWVVDDDSGIGRVVQGEPQSRVVDKSGRDAYLCAEYEWDGEYYAQDFGPQHVRRRHQTETVIQFLERQQGGGNGESDLDATRIAPGRRR